MKIMIIDGQGGGLGKSLVERLRPIAGAEHIITAIGTNSLATSAMLRAGADEGATGENAVIVNAQKADIIVGAVGVVIADSMLGELTERMASAVASSPSHKVLIPLNRCGVSVAGVDPSHGIAALIDDAANIVSKLLK